MDDFIYIYKKRIDLKNNNRLIIQTGSCAEYMKDVKAVSYVNGVKTEVVIKENPHTPLLFVYKNAEPEVLSCDDIGCEADRCGFAGSPTSVNKIESVVLAGGEFKDVPATDEGISGLVSELIADHTIG